MSRIPFRRNPWLLLILLLAFALRSKALACEALSRFERLTANDAVWPIYDLAAPAEPSVAPHSTEIQTPFAVSFGEQLELRGVSLKQLLSWPSAYQVTYYWKVLKQPAMSFRLVVHITNAAGQMAYQQDWRPWTTSKWGAGAIVRDRSCYYQHHCRKVSTACRSGGPMTPACGSRRIASASLK